MAKRVQLLSYFVRVREKQADAGFELDKWPDGGGFCKVIENCFARSNQSPIVEDESGKAISNFDLRNCEEDHKTHGFIGSGSFGETGIGKDITDGSKSYNKTVKDAEEISFYFQFRAFPSNDHGILILQKLGARGVKTPFSRLLTQHVRQRHGDYMVDFNPLAPNDYLLDLISRGMREIHLIKRRKTGDDARRLREGSWPEDPRVVATVMKADRGSSFDLIDGLRKLVQGQATHAQMVEILGEQYDDLKVKVRVGQGEKTLTLTRDNPPVAQFDITDAVDQDGRNGGHPMFATLSREADDLMQRLIEDLGIAQ